MTALWSYAAIGLLFAGAAAAGSGDYALIVPHHPPICAKTERSCQMARDAIRNGWFPEGHRARHADELPSAAVLF